MKIVKTDGYNDIFNGGGTNAPKPFYMTDSSYGVGAFYSENALARRVVDSVAEEMVAPGFKLNGLKDMKGFLAEWDALRIQPQIIDALCWARLYGGAAIVMILKDSRKLTSPASETAKIEGLRVFDRFAVNVSKRETNLRSPRYGEPVLYKVTPGGDLQEFEIHYSRIIIIDGERITEQQRRNNGGWGASVLNKSVIEAICDYDYCETIATQILRRKQQAVWKVKGLAEMCDDDEAAYAARLRLAQVDDNSGVGKAIGIDATDEEYEILNSDVNGVPDMLDKKFDRICAASGIHEIILKNRNVGGVSASQNTALETFYKMIDRKREEVYQPLLEKLLPFLIGNSADWSIEFEPLSVPTRKEEAETTNKNVDSVVKAVENQIMDSEEARDTLRAIAPEFKLKDTNKIKLPEPEVEPEPGTEQEEEKMNEQENENDED